MDVKRRVKRGLGGAATLFGIAAASYAAFVGSAWLRYGKPAAPTADEIEDPLNLRIASQVNGETRQDSTTADLVFVDELPIRGRRSAVAVWSLAPKKAAPVAG